MLIKMATSSAENRRKPLYDIAQLCGITASYAVLRKVFEEEGYFRRVARKMPFLDMRSKKRKLE